MITLDFLIVPLVLTIGGVLTLLISIFGLFAVAREVILHQSNFFLIFICCVLKIVVQSCSVNKMILVYWAPKSKHLKGCWTHVSDEKCNKNDHSYKCPVFVM